MNTTKITWSKADEQLLVELTARKSKFEAMHFEPVLNVARSIRTTVGHRPDPKRDELVAEALINHADAIRDALAPFDSGVRACADSTAG